MKIKQPAQEIEVCDFCRRDAYLQTCLVCKSEFCLTCQSLIYGCWVGARVCRKCGDLDSIGFVVRQFGKEITPIIQQRTLALGTLGIDKSAFPVVAVVRFMEWAAQSQKEPK